jgi:hypothetical protein
VLDVSLIGIWPEQVGLDRISPHKYLQRARQRKADSVNRKRNKPCGIFTEKRSREWNERDRHQEKDISPDQSVIPTVDKTEYSMVPDPICTNQKKAEKKTDKFWNELYDRTQKTAVGRAQFKVRHFDLNYQQRYSDGKNRIAEKDNTLELHF